MNKPLIFLLLINFWFIKSVGQEIPSINQVWDSITQKSDEETKQKRKLKMFLGFDLFAPAYGLFTDKKSYQAQLSMQKGLDWAYVLEVGTEKNIYDENNWNLESIGPFLKLGFDKFFIVDEYKNKNSGFYAGFRLAATQYKREPKQFPIRSADGGLISLFSLPEEEVEAFWLEIPLGARVDVLANRFYVDFSLRPKILLGGSKGKSGIEPLVVPGFGIEQSGLNFGTNWSLVYQIFR